MKTTNLLSIFDMFIYKLINKNALYARKTDYNMTPNLFITTNNIAASFFFWQDQRQCIL